MDSTGQTVDCLLTAKRDAAAAKRFFRKTLLDPANPQPRVINVDKNRAYPVAVEELKVEGTLRRRCRLRQCKYLNNVVEQDHRVSKKRVWLARGYQSSSTAWRTLQGIEAVHRIRRGRARGWAKVTHSPNCSLSTTCLGWPSDAGQFGRGPAIAQVFATIPTRVTPIPLRAPRRWTSTGEFCSNDC